MGSGAVSPNPQCCSHHPISSSVSLGFLPSLTQHLSEPHVQEDHSSSAHTVVVEKTAEKPCLQLETEDFNTYSMVVLLGSPPGPLSQVQLWVMTLSTTRNPQKSLHQSQNQSNITIYGDLSFQCSHNNYFSLLIKTCIGSINGFIGSLYWMMYGLQVSLNWGYDYSERRMNVLFLFILSEILVFNKCLSNIFKHFQMQDFHVFLFS